MSAPQPSPLVRVHNVFKRYSRNTQNQTVASLLRSLIGKKEEHTALEKHEFWALKNFSFELFRGEALGLIGDNGSGKSTTLKLINGLFLPDRGRIEIDGSLEALIELGAGFHPNLSGRENVLMKLALQGIGKADAEKKFDEIVEFAELGEFIDMPVKNYSSGMYARLGFSTSALSNPDILLVDEVLSVGDFRFRQKCLDKINNLKRSSAVILVSHSAQTLRMFCDRGVVLKKGECAFEGAIEDALDFYAAECQAAVGSPVASDKKLYGEEFHNQDKIEIHHSKWVDRHGLPKNQFFKDEPLFLDISFTLKCRPQRLIIGVPLWPKNSSNLLTAFNSDLLQQPLPNDPGKKINVRLQVESWLTNGQYVTGLAIHDGPEYLFRKVLPSFEIYGHNPRRLGLAAFPHKWVHSEIKVEAQIDAAQ